MALPEDIVIKIRQDFSEDDSLCALQMFKELCAENPSLFSDRILRCLVVLARGRIEKLTKAVALARSDWRDLISFAEYHSGNRVRLLSLPFGAHPEMESFKRWFAGQQIEIPWACNEKWIIDYSEIRELSLEQVCPLKDVSRTISDPSLYIASLNILCIRGSAEISASNAMEGKILIVYRIHPVTNEFEFKKFSYNPKHLGKRGRW